MVTVLRAQPLIQQKIGLLDRLNQRNRLLVLGLILVIMLLWSGFSWLIAQRYTAQMQQQSYQHQKHLAQQQLEVLNGSLHDVLTTLGGITRILAREAQIERGLGPFGPAVKPGTGPAATRRLRWEQDPALRHIPVQMLTLDEDRQHGLARGAFDFISKPVDPDKLFALLLRWLVR